MQEQNIGHKEGDPYVDLIDSVKELKHSSYFSGALFWDSETKDNTPTEIMPWVDINSSIIQFMSRDTARTKLHAMNITENMCSVLLEHLQTLYNTPSDNIKTKVQQDLSTFATYLKKLNDSETDTTASLDKVCVYFKSLEDGMNDCHEGTAERLGSIVVSIDCPSDLAGLIWHARFTICRYIAASSVHEINSVHAMERVLYHLTWAGIQLPTNLNSATFGNGTYEWGDEQREKFAKEFTVDNFINCMISIVRQLVREEGDLLKWYETKDEIELLESKILTLLNRYGVSSKPPVRLFDTKECGNETYNTSLNELLLRYYLIEAMRYKYIKPERYLYLIRDVLGKIVKQKDKTAIDTLLESFYKEDLIELYCNCHLDDPPTSEDYNFMIAVCNVIIKKRPSSLLDIWRDNKLGLECVKNVNEGLSIKAINAVRNYANNTQDWTHCRQVLLNQLSCASSAEDVIRIYELFVALCPLSVDESNESELQQLLTDGSYEWELQQLLYAWYLAFYSGRHTTDPPGTPQQPQVAVESNPAKTWQDQDMQTYIQRGIDTVLKLINRQGYNFFEKVAEIAGQMSFCVTEMLVTLYLNLCENGEISEAGIIMTRYIYTSPHLNKYHNRFEQINRMYRDISRSTFTYHELYMQGLSLSKDLDGSVANDYECLAREPKVLLLIETCDAKLVDRLVFNKPLIMQIIALLPTRSALGELSPESSLSSSKMDVAECFDRYDITLSCLNILCRLVQSEPVKANQLGNQIIPHLDRMINQLLAMHAYYPKRKRPIIENISTIIVELSKNSGAANVLIANKKLQDFLRYAVVEKGYLSFKSAVLSLAQHAVDDMHFDSLHEDNNSLLLCLIHMLDSSGEACIHERLPESMQAGSMDHDLPDDRRSKLNKLLILLIAKQNIFKHDHYYNKFLLDIEKQDTGKFFTHKISAKGRIFHFLAQALSFFCKKKPNPFAAGVDFGCPVDFEYLRFIIDSLNYISNNMQEEDIINALEDKIDALMRDITLAIEYLKETAIANTSVDDTDLIILIARCLSISTTVVSVLDLHRKVSSTAVVAFDEGLHKFVVLHQFVTSPQKTIPSLYWKKLFDTISLYLKIKQDMMDDEIRVLIRLLQACSNHKDVHIIFTAHCQFSLIMLIYFKSLNKLDNNEIRGAVFNLLCINSRKNEGHVSLSLIDYIAVPICEMLGTKNSEPASDHSGSPSCLGQQTIRFCTHLVKYLQSKLTQSDEPLDILTAPVQNILIAFATCTDYDVELSAEYLQVFTHMIEQLDEASQVTKAICSPSQITARLFIAAQDTKDPNRMLAAHKSIFALLKFTDADDLLLADIHNFNTFKDNLREFLRIIQGEGEVDSVSMLSGDYIHMILEALLVAPSALAKLFDASEIYNMCVDYSCRPLQVRQLLTGYTYIMSNKNTDSLVSSDRFTHLLNSFIDKWLDCINREDIAYAVQTIKLLLVDCKAKPDHRLFSLLARFKKQSNDDDNITKAIDELKYHIYDSLRPRMYRNDEPVLEMHRELCCVYVYLYDLFGDIKPLSSDIKDQTPLSSSDYLDQLFVYNSGTPLSFSLDIILYIAALDQLASNTINLGNTLWEQLILFVLRCMNDKSPSVRGLLSCMYGREEGLKLYSLQVGDILRGLYRAREVWGMEVKWCIEYKNYVIQQIDICLNTLRLLPSPQFKTFNDAYLVRKGQKPVARFFGRVTGRNALAASMDERHNEFITKLRQPELSTTKRLYDEMVRSGELMTIKQWPSSDDVDGEQNQAVVAAEAEQHPQPRANR